MSTDRLEYIAYSWAVRCFGEAHVHDLIARGLRTAEEPIEFMQAVGVPREQAHRLVDVVYDRPVGEPMQELGGMAMTLAVLLHRMGTSYESALVRELNRVLAKPPGYFAQRNREKVALGLVGHVS